MNVERVVLNFSEHFAEAAWERGAEIAPFGERAWLLLPAHARRKLPQNFLDKT